jgi:Rieske Fe-S protein
MNVLLERLVQAPGASVHFVKDRLTKAPTDDASKLGNGEGALIQVDGRKLAVYKDDGGALHVMSPVCRHLRCIVDWNPREKTWDCPCHGSRYDAYGKVIHGPAKSDLLPEQL